MKTNLARTLLCALVLTAGLQTVSQSPAAASHRVHHWNMCGNACPLNNADYPNVDHSSSWSAALYVVAASNPQPIAFGLNEVCFSAMAPFLDDFQSLGYTWSVDHKINTNVSETQACGDYGNTVFHIGNYLSKTRYWFPAQVSNDNDSRGMICVRYDIYARVVTCSAHLTNKNDSTAIAQAVLYRDKVNDVYTGKCRQITGDFNLYPHEEYPDWFDYYDPSYDEVDEPAPWQSTHPPSPSGENKLDYIWLSDPQHSESFSLSASTGVLGVSDHKYLSATINFEASCP